MKTLNQEYIMIPDWIINKSELTDGALRVLIYFYSKPYDFDIQEVNIAKELGINISTLIDRINELKNHNMIEVVKVGEECEYHLQTKNPSNIK